MALEFSSKKETFPKFRTFETTLAGRPLVVETGKMCGLSNGSAMIRYGETCVLCNVVMSAKPRDGIDFFPLSVEFEEKMYAVGRIPGSFMRREGRPGEKAVLTSRVIDRPIRPLFPHDMRNDVCVTMTVMSLDPDNSAEIAGMIGTSLVLSISDIPWNGPIGGVQVGLVDGQIVLNPTKEQRAVSELAMTVAASQEKIVMIEAGANEVDEQTVLEGIKIANVKIADLNVRAAVAHGLGNARKLMDAIEAGEEFHFVEIMACPGGCVNGGGQPLQLADVRNWVDIKAERAKGLYTEDRKSFIRKSHNNPAIKKLYKEFLGMAGGSKAHQLLHTHYAPRDNYEK